MHSIVVRSMANVIMYMSEAFAKVRIAEVNMAVYNLYTVYVLVSIFIYLSVAASANIQKLTKLSGVNVRDS